MHGLYTALVTPLIDDCVDEEGLAENIRFQIASGVHGLVVLGSTGEAATMTDQERDAVIRCAVAAVKGRVPLVVGTGDNATHRAIHKTRRALELGADLALVVTPYYNRPTQEGMVLHYQALAAATPLPLLMYNVPVRTGVNLDAESIRRLMAVPTIVGIKEEFSKCGLVVRLARELRPDSFAVFSGNDVSALPEMALGACGVISTVGNLVPAEMTALVTAMREMRYDDARDWHYRLLPLFQAAFIETNPAPIKAAMAYFDMPAGHCRLPLTQLHPDNLRKLHSVLDALTASKPC